MAAINYDIYGGTVLNIGEMTMGMATSYPNFTDEMTYIEVDDVEYKKKCYIHQCRMFLFEKLGAVLRWDHSIRGIIGGIPRVLYWEPVGNSPPQSRRFPAFSSCVFH